MAPVKRNNTSNLKALTFEKKTTSQHEETKQDTLQLNTTKNNNCSSKDLSPLSGKSPGKMSFMERRK